MFASFFPKPRMLLLSALGWSALCVFVWYRFGAVLGVPASAESAASVIGLGFFVTPEFLRFYFNIARYTYLQADNIFVYLILVPTIVARKVTFGLLQQILTAFGHHLAAPDQ